MVETCLKGLSFFFKTQKTAHAHQPHTQKSSPQILPSFIGFAEGTIPSVHFTTTTAIPQSDSSKRVPATVNNHHAALLNPIRLPLRVQKTTPGRPARLRPGQYRRDRYEAFGARHGGTGLFALSLAEAVSLFFFFSFSFSFSIQS